jgi:hypothetical protein
MPYINGGQSLSVQMYGSLPTVLDPANPQQGLWPSVKWDGEDAAVSRENGLGFFSGHVAVPGDGSATTAGTEEDWYAVPGDEFAEVYPMKVALQGDNLVADLEIPNFKQTFGVEAGGQVGASIAPEIWNNIDLQAYVYYPHDVLFSQSGGVYTVTANNIVHITDLAHAQDATTGAPGTIYNGNLILARFQAANENDGQLDPDIPQIDTPAITSTMQPNVCVLLTGTFPKNPDQEGTQSDPDSVPDTVLTAAGTDADATSGGAATQANTNKVLIKILDGGVSLNLTQTRDSKESAGFQPVTQ